MKKSTSLRVLLFLCLVGITKGTPSQAVAVDEQPAGSNHVEYAILRTETDNLGSNYDYRRKIWLDEFTKSAANAPGEPRRTLLMDVSYAVDVDHTDRNSPPNVKETQHLLNPDLAWATVLQRYTQRTWKRWTPEQMAKLTVDPVAGIRFNDRLLLISGDDIQGRVFGGRLSETNWTLEEVSEDSNSLYFRLGKVLEDGDHEFRIAAISTALSKQVADQAILKPLYLVAGRFDSPEEALQEVRALQARAFEQKSYGFHPEVWSVWEPTDRIVHVIAQANSMQLIESGRMKSLEKALGIEWVPTTSTHFQERTLP